MVMFLAPFGKQNVPFDVERSSFVGEDLISCFAGFFCRMAGPTGCELFIDPLDDLLGQAFCFLV